MATGIKHDGLRLVTPGEILLASSLYGYTIRYNKVWIHRGSYLPFELQKNNFAMTPNGEMWFQEGVYEPDFSRALRSPVDSRHLFMHEMMHVWQHQRGMWVRTRGAFSWIADYTYDLDQSDLLDYSLEQQACIVSDYWLLNTYGFTGHSNLYNLRHFNPAEPLQLLLAKYKKVMGNFPS